MDLKQIIQLYLDGYSNRNIGLTLGISRNTVNHYMKLFKASDYPMEGLLSFDQNHLRSQFPAYTTIDNKRYDELMLYFEKVNKARLHPGFTFYIIIQSMNKPLKSV